MRGDRPIAYRPDIDGMRALAVLAVVGYHAAPGVIKGGYVGVDVFFVISGFLISSIILSEREAGSFSLVGFYGRRIRRLFPALALVLAATWLLGWFYLLPHEFRALGKHMAAGAAYFINFTLKRESGYFDVAADDKPLLHLWSLSVEEQFYIFWPLLLLLIRGRRSLIAVIAALAIASFVGGLHALGKNQASAFYLPHWRVWELAVGRYSLPSRSARAPAPSGCETEPWRTSAPSRGCWSCSCPPFSSPSGLTTPATLRCFPWRARCC